MRRAGREVCHGDPSPVEKDGLTLATNKTILTRQFPIPRGAFLAIFILPQTIHFYGRYLDFYAPPAPGSILNVMNKLIELRRAKMLALSLLLIAAATFVVTLFLPANFWVSGVKAIAEAAMVGALADWFAVVALFRRVPIPIISRHTAIIPRNKDRIGENLGQFVQEKFLDTQSLVALIRRHEPALLIGNWFSQPENARRVGQHLLQIMSGFIELTDDARIQRLLKRAVHKAIDKVDLSGTSALMLESMTKNNRHQVLLDTLIT